MTREDRINKIYFEWLRDFIVPYPCPKSGDFAWSKLHRLMYNTEYEWVIDRDENRACDGTALRWRFILENPEYEQYVYILDGPCNVLEMIVALAVRCEEQIMDDPRYGNRTHQWYNYMIASLGLNGQYNCNYDRRACKEKIKSWMNNDFEPNGKGSLFTFKNPPEDMRAVEIWVQLNWWLKERFL